MALLFIDGFDTQTSVANTLLRYDSDSVAGGLSISSSHARTSNCALRDTNQAAFEVKKTLPSSYQTLIVGINLDSSTNGVQPDDDILNFYDGTNLQLKLRLLGGATSTSLRAINGQGTTLGTSTASFTQGSHYIEVIATFHSSTGAVTIYLDGVNVLALTGVRTTGSGGNQATKVSFASTRTFGWSGYDDYYICDSSGAAPWNTVISGGNPNNLPKVGTKTISGTGNLAQWTPLSGLNYTQVNESDMNSDTSYNSTYTIGASDLYSLTSSGLTTNIIYGVQATSWTKLDSTGSRTASMEWKSGATVYDGSIFTENGTSSYTPHMEMKTLDPNTNAQWTRANLDALQIGMKLQS